MVRGNIYNMRIILHLLLFTCLSSIADAQVTNIEARRLRNDTLRWYWEANTGFRLVKEVGNIFTLNNDGRMHHRKDKNLYMALAEYNWSGARGRTLTHNTFLHLRYNRFFENKWLAWEGFTQFQFNEITRINIRWLLGTGPRFRLYHTDKGSINIGILYMFEITKEKTLDGGTRLLVENRKSSYLAISIFPAENISLLSTTYYQPRLNQWSDYRLNNITELRARINKHFTMSIAYRLTFDAVPAEGAPRFTHNFENKIGIVF